MFILLLTGCATTTKVAEIKYDNFRKAVKVKEPEQPQKIVKVAEPLPLPGQLKKLPKKLKPKAKAKKLPLKERLLSANKAAKFEPSKDGFINAIQVYPFTKGALYKLYSAVNQVSDIALQPGEKLISVSAGDTVRWIVGDTKSGKGAEVQVHILVKPIAPDIETNLVITTDRRTYHLELQSQDKAYMSSVSWVYPHDDLVALNKQNTAVSMVTQNTIDRGVTLEKLNFRYRIKGIAPWKPIRAFDDGRKVYIQFPSGLSQGDAPPLFVMGSNGKPALVNYRVKGTYYIVDRLFAAAELRLGVKPQKIVRIVRTDAVWKEVRQ